MAQNMEAKRHSLPFPTNRLPTRNYQQGAIIFREGDKPDGMYYIDSGEIELFINSSKGSILLMTLGPGSVFGEMGVIDGKPRSATAIAKSNCTCHLIHKQDMYDKVCSLEPLMQGLFLTIVHSLRQMNEELRKRVSVKIDNASKE